MSEQEEVEKLKREIEESQRDVDEQKEKIKGIGTGIANIPKMIMVYFSPWSADAPALDLPHPRTLVHLP